MSNPMQPVGLNDIVAVGEAPTVTEIAILAKSGFRALINTQPDGELDRLMPSCVAAAEAARHGLAYRYIPIESRYLSQAQIEAFAAALAELPKPIYAYCYSGSRAAAAWALAEAANTDADALIAACRTADLDIAFLRPQLAARRIKPTAAGPVASEPAKAATPVAAILSGNGATAGSGQPKLTDVVAGPTSAAAMPRSLPPAKPPILPVPHRASS